MFVVVFIVSSFALEEEQRYEYYFKSETDANNFYNDLENFVDKKTGGGSYVVYKSEPEESYPVQVYGYDPKVKNLYLVD